MTREEAIEVLKHTEDNIKYDKYRDEIYFTHEWVGAYEMAIAALREQPRWISVEERLPEMYKDVLVLYPDNAMTVAVFTKYGSWETDSGFEYDALYFSHWMPLPEPPEEEV